MDNENRVEYIQVGYTALRDPASGELLPSVPLYIKGEEFAVEEEERLIDDLARLFNEKMNAYVDGCAKYGIVV